MAGKHSKNYLGRNFIWWFGVVEDRNDPLKVGRVRVRCYGWHSDDKNDIPTEHLPWAQVVNGITSASMGDIGHSPTGLVEGSWVVGFFLDGPQAQQPMVLGSISGIPQDYAEDLPYKTKGFIDPNGIYPLRKNEPDVNSLSRNDDYMTPGVDSHTQGTDSIRIKQRHHEKINDGGRLTIPIGLANSHPLIPGFIGLFTSSSGNTALSYNEPVSTYQASYPHNHVYQTEGGHIKEYDDTWGYRRIHESHPSGTFYDIDETGNKITRVVGNQYSVMLSNNHVYVEGNAFVTIKGDVRTKIDGNRYTEVLGNDYEFIKGNKYIQVGDKNTESNTYSLIYGRVEEEVKKSWHQNIGTELDSLLGEKTYVGEFGTTYELKTGGSMITSIGGEKHLKVERKMATEIGAENDLIVATNMDITTGSNFNVDAGPDIYLNSGAAGPASPVLPEPPEVTDPGLVENTTVAAKRGYKSGIASDGNVKGLNWSADGNNPPWPAGGGGIAGDDVGDSRHWMRFLEEAGPLDRIAPINDITFKGPYGNRTAGKLAEEDPDDEVWGSMPVGHPEKP